VVREVAEVRLLLAAERLDAHVKNHTSAKLAA
jgi:hypothetical protein